MKLSSQSYIDNETVDAKREAHDYVVTLAAITNPATGIEYDLVIDGHHSYAAAIADGARPVYEYSDYNYQAEVECIGFDNFLEAHWIDGEWHDLETGEFAF